MGLKALTRHLHADERPQLLAHLLALDEEDRRRRFDAKTVAQERYRACMAGRPAHVAGSVNELAVQWIKYQPRWLMRACGSVFGKSRDA